MANITTFYLYRSTVTNKIFASYDALKSRNLLIKKTMLKTTNVYSRSFQINTFEGVKSVTVVIETKNKTGNICVKLGDIEVYNQFKRFDSLADIRIEEIFMESLANAIYFMNECFIMRLQDIDGFGARPEFLSTEKLYR